ncbi:MAG: ABC transporter ATP-binding protein, partial [Actinomycetota bacterium]|nr:ABC transporter ATP-binding protein [Actinomycetota bacterium]
MLAVEDLHVYYGAIAAVKGVTIRVKPGEIVTLIGSNGAGKSTTLRAISGLLRPKSGGVTFEGKSLVGIPGHKVVGMGITHSPEGRRIFPKMTVEENLDLGAFLRKDKTEIAGDKDRLFDLFPRLKERQTQKAGTLSGGEQQMLAIARALMSRPRLLLLDEPSLGLAPLIVKQIFNALRELNRSEGLTVFLVEQNAYHALQLAHRGYVMA